MRPLGELLRIEPPHPRECRIVEPQPAVAAEHRHRLGQIVEGFALHADQSIEAALEIEPLGDVVEQINHAAFRIGRRHHPQGAAVRQMPLVLLRLDRPIGFVQRGLPLAEILIVGKLAGGAQSIEHRGIGRPLIEEAGVEIPQRPIGGIVEAQLLVGAEDRDAGRELIERAPVRLDHALELGAHQLRLGRVDGDAGAAAGGRHGDHVEAPAAAGRHRGQPAGIGSLRLRARAAARLRAARSNSSMPPCDRLGRILGLDRARIGRIHEHQLAGIVARSIPAPAGPRSVRAKAAVSSTLLLVARGELGELVLDAAHLAQPQDRAPADDLAFGLDDAVRRAS